MRTPSGRACPRCEGTQERGFLLDCTQNQVRVAQWAEGEPEYYILRIMKMKGRRRLEVRTMRCRKCGYLESYASEPAK